MAEAHDALTRAIPAVSRLVLRVEGQRDAAIAIAERALYEDTDPVVALTRIALLDRGAVPDAN